METKPFSDFGSHRGHRDGLQNYCKECRSLEGKKMLTPEQLENKRKNRERFALESRKVIRRGFRYNLSPEEYDAMVAEQDGKCAICGGTETYEHKSLCVDHDHRTGEVRGLLCSRCNKALGAFFDSQALLNSAANYLERTGTLDQWSADRGV